MTRSRRYLMACTALLLTAAGDSDKKPDPFVDLIVAFEPGVGAGHHRDEPEVVLGPPRGGGKLSPSDHVLSLGKGGRITLEFVDNEVFDGKGPDFIVFENPFLKAP